MAQEHFMVASDSMGSSVVLVVSGNPDVRDRAAAWLEAAGYRVRCLSDGRETLAMVSRQCPDVMVVDREVGGMHGQELSRLVRLEKLPRDVYLLLLAPGASDDELAAAHDAGVNDFVAHPVEQRELLARVRRAVDWLEILRRQTALADADPLTGLFNRRAFNAYCQREINLAARFGRPLSCALLDVDFFKKVNDTYGHAAGDAALRAVAGVLQAHSRSSDYVCRLGGDEFVLTLPETTEEDAAQLAERIRAAVAQLEVPAGGARVSLRATIGVAQWQPSVAGPQELADLADRAMLNAKHAGRNRVERYSAMSS